MQERRVRLYHLYSLIFAPQNRCMRWPGIQDYRGGSCQENPGRTQSEFSKRIAANFGRIRVVYLPTVDLEAQVGSTLCTCIGRQYWLLSKQRYGESRY